MWQDVSNWCIRIKVYRDFVPFLQLLENVLHMYFLTFYFEKISNIWGIH